METTIDPDSERPTPSTKAPPLTLPREVWEPLSHQQKAVYRDAEIVLGVLDGEAPETLSALRQKTRLSAEQALLALKTLDAMNLVSVGMQERNVVVELIAVPDEHVRVVGPDGKQRWLFVARPLVPPQVAPELLN